MKNLLLTLCLIGGALKANAQERDVYYSNPSAGYGSWDVVSNWSIYAASGGGKLNVLPTFRYDHTQVKAYESIRLYRYNGSAWVQVGSGTPDGTSLISASAPLPPVNGEVGWFAVVTKPRGTLISVQ